MGKNMTVPKMAEEDVIVEIINLREMLKSWSQSRPRPRNQDDPPLSDHARAAFTYIVKHCGV